MRLLLGLTCASIFSCMALAQTDVQATVAQTRLDPGISPQMADAVRTWWQAAVASEMTFDALLSDELRCNPPRGISSPNLENFYQRRRQGFLSALRTALFEAHQAWRITHVYYLGSQLIVAI